VERILNRLIFRYNEDMDLSTLSTIFASIGFGGILGAIIAAIINSKSAQKDREYDFKNNEYITLKEQAVILMEYIDKLYLLSGEFMNEIRAGYIENITVESGISKNDQKNDIRKARMFGVINLYFRDISTEYNDYASAMGTFQAHYFDLQRASVDSGSELPLVPIKGLTPELIENIKADLDKVNEKSLHLINAIQILVELEKVNVV
jgi:hypothetical protein